MKVILGSAHPYLPQLTGGAQVSTHEIATDLIRRGHAACVLSGLTGAGRTGLRARLLLKLTGRRTAVDRGLGYPTYRGWFAQDGVDEVIARERPDVVLLQSGRPVPIARRFLDRGVPVVLYLRNVEPEDLGGDLRTLGQVPAIANSAFTAARYRDVFGLRPTVVHPTFTPERYRTSTTRRNVTFINPRPEKGLDTALAVARACPDIPFVFVEAWGMTPAEHGALLARIADLDNVTLRPGTDDMRQVYGEARIVLAPSRWEEAFGRIAAEAHFSAIPVIGSRCGGLPEAIGPGGLLVDPDAPIEEWVAAVRSVWDDAGRLEALSRAAAVHAARPALDRDSQIGAILEVLGRAAAARPESGG